MRKKTTKNRTNKNKKNKKTCTFVNKCVHHFCCAAHIIAWEKESSLYLVISK